VGKNWSKKQRGKHPSTKAKKKTRKLQVASNIGGNTRRQETKPARGGKRKSTPKI